MRRRLLGDKCQHQVVDDPVHHGIVCDEGDDAHPALAFRADQRVNLINLTNHLGPAPARDSRTLLLNEEQGMLIGLCLSHLTSVGVGVDAVRAHSSLVFLENMGIHPAMNFR